MCILFNGIFTACNHDSKVLLKSRLGVGKVGLALMYCSHKRNNDVNSRVKTHRSPSYAGPQCIEPVLISQIVVIVGSRLPARETKYLVVAMLQHHRLHPLALKAVPSPLTVILKLWYPHLPSLTCPSLICPKPQGTLLTTARQEPESNRLAHAHPTDEVAGPRHVQSRERVNVIGSAWAGGRFSSRFTIIAGRKGGTGA